MGKTIEAKAIISAEDKTGQTFDKVARKIEGVSKAAKAFSGIKPPQFIGDFGSQLDKLKATERELQIIRKAWADFDRQLKSGGRIGAAKYLDAMNLWKSNMVNALRDSRAAMDEHERRQQRFFQRARNMAVGAAGVIGGAYLAERGAKSGIRAAAERSREMARYGLGGLTEDEKAAAGRKADEIAARNPTVSRTDILGHIRQLRARLGSFEHAIDNVETVTKAQTVLGTLGKGGEGAAEDLEKLTLALESQGLGSSPDKFRDYMDAFVKAKSLFPDLKGEDFRQYMQTSNSSKYGLSADYLKTIAPTMMQHEGASNFGTMQASAFSALIGGRQTKQAKAVMRGYGLLDDSNNLIDQKSFISNPRDWAERNLRTHLEKGGVQTDEDHRGDVVEALAKMFSNRKVGEYFASMLVNKGVIDKDREMLGKAKGTEGADQARHDDAYQAVTAITTQLKDASAAFLNLQPVINAMNAMADKLSGWVSSFDQMNRAEKTGAIIGTTALGGAAGYLAVQGASSAYQWFTGMGQLSVAATSLQAAAAELTAAAAIISGKNVATAAAGAAGSAATGAAGGAAAGGASASIWGMGARALAFAPPAMLAAGVAGGLFAMHKSVEDAGYSGLTSGERMRRQRGGRSVTEMLRHEWGYDKGTSSPEVSDTMTYGTGVGGDRQVDVSVTGTTDVKGEAQVTVKVEAGSSLLQVVEQAQTALKLAGQTNINGPGSRGISSPDAAPGARGFGGAGSQPY